jgi:hypothetical protein
LFYYGLVSLRSVAILPAGIKGAWCRKIKSTYRHNWGCPNMLIFEQKNSANYSAMDLGEKTTVRLGFLFYVFWKYVQYSWLFRLMYL